MGDGLSPQEGGGETGREVGRRGTGVTALQGGGMTNGRFFAAPVTLRAGFGFQIPECRPGSPGRREADGWPDLGVYCGDVVLP
jgi:hypothetical protein